ncbi:hypothetical protein D3C72_1506970 [compost metagenome]
MPRHRRAYLGTRQVEPGRIEGGLCLLVFGQGGGGQVAGILAALARHHQVIHVGAAVGVDLAHLQRRLARRHQGLGLLDRNRVVGRVDAQQQVAHLHVLVVAHRHLNHQPGHIRGDVDHVGAHPAIAGPGGVHVVQPEGAHQQHREDEDEQGHADTEDSFQGHGGLNGRWSAPGRHTGR